MKIKIILFTLITLPSSTLFAAHSKEVGMQTKNWTLQRPVRPQKPVRLVRDTYSDAELAMMTPQNRNEVWNKRTDAQSI